MNVTCKSFHEFEEKSKKVLELNEDKFKPVITFNVFFLTCRFNFQVSINYYDSIQNYLCFTIFNVMFIYFLIKINFQSDFGTYVTPVVSIPEQPPDEVDAVGSLIDTSDTLSQVSSVS